MKKIFVLLVCFSLTGCVTLNSVKQDIKTVNYDDGINEKEALAIAREI